MISLNNICPHMQVAKGFLQTCPKIQQSLLGSTNSNFGEYPQDFLCFFVTYYYREIKQESSINRVSQKLQINFLDQFDRSSKSFDRSSKSFDQSNILKLEFSQRKFQISKFHFIHFTNEYSPTLYHYYNISLYIPIYTISYTYELYNMCQTFLMIYWLECINFRWLFCLCYFAIFMNKLTLFLKNKKLIISVLHTHLIYAYSWILLAMVKVVRIEPIGGTLVDGSGPCGLCSSYKQCVSI